MHRGDIIWMCSESNQRVLKWETCCLCEFRKGKMKRSTMDEWCRLHIQITPKGRIDQNVAKAIIYTLTCDECAGEEEADTPRMKKLEMIDIHVRNGGKSRTVFVRGATHLFKSDEEHVLNRLRHCDTPNAQLIMAEGNLYLVMIREVALAEEVTISYRT